MLNHIALEKLREYPGAPVNLQTFNDELCSARSHVLKLISRQRISVISFRRKPASMATTR